MLLKPSDNEIVLKIFPYRLLMAYILQECGQNSLQVFEMQFKFVEAF
jgi:hypothetical protein